MRTHCPNCENRLTPARLCEFGNMAFLECDPCRIIWEYISREEYVKKLKGISRETKQRRSKKMPALA
jgi:hypothetical protein